MRKTCASALLLLFFSLCGSAQTPAAVPVRWDWWVVSTPDFIGPFRGNCPSFKAPTPKVPLPKTLSVNADRQVSGTFEVIVSVDGQAVVESTLNASSREAGSKARAILNHWRLNPASLDGKPIRVRLRVQVFEN